MIAAEFEEGATHDIFIFPVVESIVVVTADIWDGFEAARTVRVEL